MTKLTRKQFITFLKRGGACQAAMNWVSRTKGSPLTLVKKCPRADWIYFLASAVFPFSALDEGTRFWCHVDCQFGDTAVATEAEGQFLTAWAIDNWPMVERAILSELREN